MPSNFKKKGGNFHFASFHSHICINNSTGCGGCEHETSYLFKRSERSVGEVEEKNVLRPEKCENKIMEKLNEETIS
jgi:hypothetical protein